MDEYLFDLQGYVTLPQILPPAEVASANRFVDACMPLQPHGEWYGNVEVHSYYNQKKGATIDDGSNLQHIYEAGPVFEKMIDHPNW